MRAIIRRNIVACMCSFPIRDHFAAISGQLPAQFSQLLLDTKREDAFRSGYFYLENYPAHPDP